MHRCAQLLLWQLKAVHNQAGCNFKRFAWLILIIYPTCLYFPSSCADRAANCFLA